MIDRYGIDNARIEEAAHTVTVARQRLAHLLTDACPGPHLFVQHEDHLSPWCDACRYTAIGQRIHSWMTEKVAK